MKRLTIVAVLLAGGALTAATVSAQEAETTRRLPGRHKAGPAQGSALGAPAAASNLDVPATDFSQLKPVLPAASSGQGRGGRRKGGGGVRLGQ